MTPDPTPAQRIHRAALATCTDDELHALALALDATLTDEQRGRILGITPRAYRYRLHNAQRKIRNHLEENAA
jgi:DNA-directed RNA polymerase specialized sigma24 family protein